MDTNLSECVYDLNVSKLQVSPKCKVLRPMITAQAEKYQHKKQRGNNRYHWY